MNRIVEYFIPILFEGNCLIAFRGADGVRGWCFFFFVTIGTGHQIDDEYQDSGYQ